jgi:formate hydrogenlyase subunit 6/NADH:ubiquinone oxidoreductase subunit I
MDYTNQIREIAARLLSENRIDVFIGYRKTGFDENHLPAFITHPNATGDLVFTEKSGFNLTNYLKFEHTRNKRVGLVVKGCDSRALNLMLTENQVKRDHIYIVGIACEGVVNEQGEKAQNCLECVMPDPVVHDEILGALSGKRDYQANSDVKELWQKDLAERSRFFEEVFESCIRCNACRHSCPLCYCAKCCIDQETSTLYHGANTTSSAFHALMTWSLHLAGRCVDCRNCEKACPSHLPLHLLHKQNEQVIHEHFQGHLAGMVAQDRGAFYKYNLNDPDDFIL